MNLKDMTKEEIEALSYTDLTCILLTENKKPMSTAEPLFTRKFKPEF